MVTTNPRTTKNPKSIKTESLRYAEYYNMQCTFDGLYAASKQGKTFDKLMQLILSRENILLAYRNIKSNTGSHTAGTDRLIMRDVEKLTPDCMVAKIRNIVRNYRPRAVRRVEIPKPNGKTRPLGIPCIWDRLVQQCILQVLEPICEARFSDNSYGFRPNRSCEHAVAAANMKMQLSNLHFVVEVDIKGFFDNVDHSKLIKQIWAMGIRDKTLIYVIRQMLVAPIKMPDGSLITPTKGTPQGGLCSPLLANIVLNELDRWIESQWQEMPVIGHYKPRYDVRGGQIKSNAYTGMKNTDLKEMHIVRYADDFRIFCRTRSTAIRTMTAVTQWLEERLRLEVSQEKTRVVNLKKQYSEFLGTKMKVHPKGKKHVVKSHICNKAKMRIAKEAKEKLKSIAKRTDDKNEYEAVMSYAAYVMGIHNYYRMATHVSSDFRSIAFSLGKTAQCQLRGRITRSSENPSLCAVMKRYGKSKQLRFVSNHPIAPIGYIQTKTPINKKRSVQKYTTEGRAQIHKNLGVDTRIMLELMRQPVYENSVQFADNRISLYSGQNGKCAVTGRVFGSAEEIHCHHKLPREQGGKDDYLNLILVLEDVHTLIHATTQNTIGRYLAVLNLTSRQRAKLNKLRLMVGSGKTA